MSDAFQIHSRTVTTRVPVTILDVGGDIDFETYERLLQEAEQAISRGVSYLLIDLTDVPYVASAGLRAIHAILNRYNTAALQAGLPAGAGVKSPYVKLLNPTAEIVRTLSVTGFDMFLEVFTDLEDALASF